MREHKLRQKTYSVRKTKTNEIETLKKRFSQRTDAHAGNGTAEQTEGLRTRGAAQCQLASRARGHPDAGQRGSGTGPRLLQEGEVTPHLMKSSSGELHSAGLSRCARAGSRHRKTVCGGRAGRRHLLCLQPRDRADRSAVFFCSLCFAMLPTPFSLASGRCHARGISSVYRHWSSVACVLKETLHGAGTIKWINARTDNATSRTADKPQSAAASSRPATSMPLTTR